MIVAYLFCNEKKTIPLISKICKLFASLFLVKINWNEIDWAIKISAKYLNEDYYGGSEQWQAAAVVVVATAMMMLAVEFETFYFFIYIYIDIVFGPASNDH